MKILLCAATELELSPTLAALAQAKLPAITVVITGVGLMAATHSLTKAVAADTPDFILQAGVAGSLRADWALGTVVAVSTDTVGDFGVLENGAFRSFFDLQVPGVQAAPWVAQRLPNETPILPECGLPLANGVTVNEITTLQDRIQHYREALGADVESMEGAALHYVALLEKIPFLQLRSLSNFIGERNKAAWQLKPAVTNLNRHVQRLLTQLST